MPAGKTPRCCKMTDKAKKSKESCIVVLQTYISLAMKQSRVQKDSFYHSEYEFQINQISRDSFLKG
jgi:hypothetical protein